MGKQDDFQSHYFENKQRFADIYNGCLFGGRQLMKPEDLEEADSVVVLPSLNTKATKVIADKVRKWKGYYASVLILESQSYIDYRMVLRAMRNDLLNYEKQRVHTYQNLLAGGYQPSTDERLSRTPKDLKLAPCITLVIYIGTEDAWDGKTELYDLLNIDDDLKPYVSNYRFNLFDYHEHKDFSIFKTENRYLFEALAKSDDKEKMMQYLETCPLQGSKDPDIVSAVLGSIGRKMTTKDLERIQNKETGGYDMCKALRDMIEDGRKEGISIGRDEGISIGKQQGTIHTLFNLVNKNIISLTTAAQQASVTEEQFMKLVEQFQLNINSQ